MLARTKRNKQEAQNLAKEFHRLHVDFEGSKNQKYIRNLFWP